MSEKFEGFNAGTVTMYSCGIHGALTPRKDDCPVCTQAALNYWDAPPQLSPEMRTWLDKAMARQARERCDGCPTRHTLVLELERARDALGHILDVHQDVPDDANARRQMALIAAYAHAPEHDND